MATINKTGLEGKESFLGFWFNGRHSSEFKVIRVSGGKEFEEELLPTAKDTVIDIPGRDGSEFIQAKREKKQFKIDFAFDDLYENDIRAMKQWLGAKNPCELIFDERPYKVWTGKVTTAPKINFVPFDDTKKGVVYKGKGSITFTCFKPYARSKSKELRDYRSALNYDLTGKANARQVPFDYSENMADWKDASGIKERDPNFEYINPDVVYLKGIGLESDGSLKENASRNIGIFALSKNETYRLQVEEATLRLGITNDYNFLEDLENKVTEVLLIHPGTVKVREVIIKTDSDKIYISYPNNNGIDKEWKFQPYLIISYHPSYCIIDDKLQPPSSIPNGFTGFLYNYGDIPVAPILTIDIANISTDVKYASLSYQGSIKMILDLNVLRAIFKGDNIVSKPIIIDNEMHLILDGREKETTSKQTEKIYNNAIVAGDFFQLDAEEGKFKVNGGTLTEVKYDYLYY